MRRTPNPNKADAAKTAMYNPKQYRRGVGEPGIDDTPPPNSFKQWGVLALLAAIGAVGFYGWPKSSPAPRTSSLPLHSAAIDDTTAVSAPPPAPVDLKGLPANGQTKMLRQLSPGAALHNLEISGRSNGQHCAVRVESWEDGMAVLSVFVRAGQIANVQLPVDAVRIKTACARNWSTTSQPTSISTLTRPFQLGSAKASRLLLDDV